MIDAFDMACGPFDPIDTRRFERRNCDAYQTKCGRLICLFLAQIRDAGSDCAHHDFAVKIMVKGDPTMKKTFGALAMPASAHVKRTRVYKKITTVTTTTTFPRPAPQIIQQRIVERVPVYYPVAQPYPVVHTVPVVRTVYQQPYIHAAPMIYASYGAPRIWPSFGIGYSRHLLANRGFRHHRNIGPHRGHGGKRR
jgi:hypothetical protein